MNIDRRKLRRSLGSRVQRRSGTKHHTLRLKKVKGSQERIRMRERKPRPRTLLAKLMAEELKKSVE